MSASRDTTSLSSRRTTRVNDVEREARSQERLQSYQRRPGHLSILTRRAAERNVSKAARDFAEALARGPCHDLLVVLLEPLEYFEMVTLQEGIAASHTLSEIDRILRECSNGVRSISNTAVLDVRVFLTARMRATMSPRELSYEEERSLPYSSKWCTSFAQRPLSAASVERSTPGISLSGSFAPGSRHLPIGITFKFLVRGLQFTERSILHCIILAISSTGWNAMRVNRSNFDG